MCVWQRLFPSVELLASLPLLCLVFRGKQQCPAWHVESKGETRQASVSRLWTLREDEQGELWAHLRHRLCCSLGTCCPIREDEKNICENFLRIPLVHNSVAKKPKAKQNETKHKKTPPKPQTTNQTPNPKTPNSWHEPPNWSNKRQGQWLSQAYYRMKVSLPQYCSFLFWRGNTKLAFRCRLTLSALTLMLQCYMCYMLHCCV